MLDARGAVHLSAPLDGHQHLSDLAASSAPTAANTPTSHREAPQADGASFLPPPSGTTFVRIAAGAGLYAVITAGGEVMVFGDSASLVPLPALRGVSHFSGGASQLIVRHPATATLATAEPSPPLTPPPSLDLTPLDFTLDST